MKFQNYRKRSNIWIVWRTGISRLLYRCPVTFVKTVLCSLSIYVHVFRPGQCQRPCHRPCYMDHVSLLISKMTSVLPIFLNSDGFILWLAVKIVWIGLVHLKRIFTRMLLVLLNRVYLVFEQNFYLSFQNLFYSVFSRQTSPPLSSKKRFPFLIFGTTESTSIDDRRTMEY